MLNNSPVAIPEGKLKVGYITNIGNNKMRGACASQFSLNGKVVEISSISEEDVEKLVFEGVEAGINIRSLCHAIQKIYIDIEEFQQFLLDEKRYPREEVEQKVSKRKNKKIRELKINTERIMVEEVAHAFYYITAAQNKRKLIRLIKEKKEYPVFNYENDDNPLSFLLGDQRVDQYLADSLEMSARFWVSSFVKKYYTRSETAEEVRGEVEKVNKIRANRLDVQ